MSFLEKFIKIRKETRKLRQDCATYFRAWKSQKDKSEKLTEKNKDLKNEIRE